MIESDCGKLERRVRQVEVAGVTPLEGPDSGRVDAIDEVQELPELVVMTLEVVISAGPQITHEDVASSSVSLSNSDNHRVLALNHVLLLHESLLLRVQVDIHVSPGTKRVFGNLNPSIRTLLAEAACMTVEKVVIAVALEKHGSLLLVLSDRT